MKTQQTERGEGETDDWSSCKSFRALPSRVSIGSNRTHKHKSVVVYGTNYCQPFSINRMPEGPTV